MVISAISKENNSCYTLARIVADMATKRGAEVDFVTPETAGLPIADGLVPYDDPRTVAWQERIATIHAHFWISPEYHSGMTGGMKNLFDHLVKEPMKGDVIGLFALAGGAMAALNTLNGMAVIARSLGAWVAPEYCAVNSREVVDGLNEGSLNRIEKIVQTVIDTCGKIQPESNEGFGEF
jgi:azobenzene reductase